MSAQPTLGRSPAGWDSARVWLSRGSLALLVLWCGFWLWFAISVVSSEPRIAWQPVAFVLSVLALTFAACVFPRTGGVLLIAAGMWASYYYDNSGARALLAAPAIVLGALRAVGGGGGSGKSTR